VRQLRENLCKSSYQKLNFFILLSLLVFSAACGKQKPQVKPPSAPSPTAPPAARPVPTDPRATHPLTPEPEIKPPAVKESEARQSPAGPMIRIGLETTVAEIRISSAGEYYLTEKKPEAQRRLVKGEILLQVEREGGLKQSSVFRVQVASFSRDELASDLKRKLSKLLDEPVIVYDNKANGLKQVRVGECLTRSDAQDLQKKLSASGYSDAFIVSDSAPKAGGRTSLSLRGPDNLFLLSETGFLFQPSSPENFLRCNGKPYRGLFDIFPNKGGRLTVVNQLAMEEYLLGVLPAEINPKSYPEPAALAAIAIAARTYAMKNTGRFRADGFDLSDDTRSQVYEGVSLENKDTDEAVQQTAGLAVYYDGKLIDAMYMSTCGGRTEDSSNVFDTPPVPYLKSVFCAIESAPGKGERVLEGRHTIEQVIVADDGTVANRNIELARVIGIIPPGSRISAESLAGPVERSEAEEWIERAVKIAKVRQSEKPSRVKDITTRAGFHHYAAEAFFGAGEIKSKTSLRDMDYYLGNLRDGSAVPEATRISVTYLMKNRMWLPFSDNTVRPDEPMRRGDALSLLIRWVESAHPAILRKGTYVAHTGTGNRVRIKSGSKTEEFELSPNPSLFRLDSGRTTPVAHLRAIGNEKVYFHVTQKGTIDFLEMELSPTGAASDRYSPAAMWDVTFTRTALAEKLRSIAGNIGEFRDLTPARIGTSGRAVQMQVSGTRGAVTLNGYRVRNALGLKDTLFTIKREYNPDGSIASFTFHGHGSGHGVGLCQVGAFGMARAGHSYEEILKTYYQGVEIRKAY